MNDYDFSMDTGVDLDATTDVQMCDISSGEPLADDKGTPVTITVISSQSETFKRKVHSIQSRYKLKAKNNTGPNKGSLTFAQEEDYTAEIYAAVMAGWHLAKRNGGPALDIPFTEKNAVTWCKANPLYAAQLSSGSDDLAKFASDVEGNFTSKGSATSTKASSPKSS